MEALMRWLGKKKGTAPHQGVECLGCGRCCDLFGRHLRASKADLERWQHLERADLLARVNRLGWIWVDPQTKKPEPACPFLNRTGEDEALCSIHDVKPDMCRAYPTLAHGRRCLRGVHLV